MEIKTVGLKIRHEFSNFSCSFLGVVGSTNMNAHSSRSHAIFSITVESSEEGDDGQQHVKMGKLHLVDLAVSLVYYVFEKCG